jgi:hypothetical protein
MDILLIVTDFEEIASMFVLSEYPFRLKIQEKQDFEVIPFKLLPAF